MNIHYELKINIFKEKSEKEKKNLIPQWQKDFQKFKPIIKILPVDIKNNEYQLVCENFSGFSYDNTHNGVLNKSSIGWFKFNVVEDIAYINFIQSDVFQRLRKHTIVPVTLEEKFILGLQKDWLSFLIDSILQYLKNLNIIYVYFPNGDQINILTKSLSFKQETLICKNGIDYPEKYYYKKCDKYILDVISPFKREYISIQEKNKTIFVNRLQKIYDSYIETDIAKIKPIENFYEKIVYNNLIKRHKVICVNWGYCVESNTNLIIL